MSSQNQDFQRYEEAKLLEAQISQFEQKIHELAEKEKSLSDNIEHNTGVLRRLESRREAAVEAHQKQHLDLEYVQDRVRFLEKRASDLVEGIQYHVVTKQAAAARAREVHRVSRTLMAYADHRLNQIDSYRDKLLAIAERVPAEMRSAALQSLLGAKSAGDFSELKVEGNALEEIFEVYAQWSKKSAASTADSPAQGAGASA